MTASGPQPAVPRKRTALRPAARAFLQGAVETMARVRGEKGRSIFAFTAPHGRSGTSYIVNLLAEELVAQFDGTIAVIPSEALKGCDPKRLPQGYTEKSPGLWTALADETLQHLPDFALENIWISPGVQSFDFVLVDCPALESIPLALRWASEVDGVVLIVEAGVTRVDQVETSQRLLQTSGGRLVGMILNRRTYPIPKFLYKLL